MRIAIIGTGVSGLVCAHRLHREHDLTIFEAGDYIGGHTHTVDVPLDGRIVPVDTGFIVFNRRNYPEFCRIIDTLGVSSVPTRMSFSYRDDATRFEWGGATLNGLFAQRRNALRPSHYRMIADIRRFGPIAQAAARAGFADASLGEFLDAHHFSPAFVQRYLLPMAGAIWSAPPAQIRHFPFRHFVNFFDSHGMLTPWDPPQWRYIAGGSRTYVKAIARPFRDRIRLACPVASVKRSGIGVHVRLADGTTELFDEVIIATHSDQALRLLADPTPAERSVLGAIPYKPNDVALHTDRSLLPRRRAAWAAWNYHTSGEADRGVTVTYSMNILQNLPTRTPVNVTLNATGQIRPDSIIERLSYHHPVYTRRTFEAQQKWTDISGTHRIHYCGAYWGYGFHEDGVRSALRVCQSIGIPA